MEIVHYVDLSGLNGVVYKSLVLLSHLTHVVILDISRQDNDKGKMA